MTRLQSLHLDQFRNYPTVDLAFSPGKNIFLGANGQGKTNLLEALYLLSHARSHRTSNDRELMRRAEPELLLTRVTAALVGPVPEDIYHLEAVVRTDGDRLKTLFRWNEVPLRSRSAVLGHLPTVSFFLPDLLLLRGAPDDRRRWLDAAIVQYDHRHLRLVSDFQKIRQQKNRLLKEPPQAISKEHLTVWNTQFAAAGARLTASRLEYLALIEPLSQMAYIDLSDGAERLTIGYQTSAWPGAMPSFAHGGRPDVAALETALLISLEAKMPDEIRRGTSLVGPHRDDLQFALNDLAADAYGSQGQQRGIVLALKLAELKALTARLGKSPVLLLDDVMAELDPTRQRLLLEHIQPDSQVFMTTTHPTGSWRSFLERDAGELAVFQVDNGQVAPGRIDPFDPVDRVMVSVSLGEKGFER